MAPIDHSEVTYSASERDEVCARCSEIPWEHLSQDIPSTDLLIFDDVVEKLRSSDCRVCRILLATLPPNYPMNCKPRLSWRRSHHCGRQEIGYMQLSDAWSGQDLAIPRYLDVTRLSPTAANEHLHKSHPKRVDFELIKSWILDCKSSHAGCRSGSLSHLKDLKVIDCERREVVRAPADCSFVALSYVWGHASGSTFAHAPNASDELPHTVHDAIHATKMLGSQYLWVDRYCINQDTASDKHNQIQQMGAIYSAAQVTLIACAGKDASYGLPGVGNERPLSGSLESIGPVTLILYPEESITQLSRSTWASRAWTYQEGFLSTRRLFFAERQVIFICNEAVKHEIREEGEEQRRDNLGALGKALPHDIHRLGLAMGMLEEYSGRSLSFETDALNAIVGALNTLENEKPPLRHIFATPLSRLSLAHHFVQPETSAADLDSRSEDGVRFALHWFHASTVSRRPEFPSWSPLGWKGTVGFYGHDQPHIPEDCFIEALGGTNSWPLPLLLDCNSESFRDISTHFSQHLRVTAYTIDLILANVHWNLNNVEEARVTDGHHFIIPWIDDLEVCIRPLWDDANFDMTERSSFTCVTLSRNLPVTMGRPFSTIFIILDWRGTHYERVGCFRHLWTHGRNTGFRGKDGRTRKLDLESYKRHSGPLPWLQYAKQQTFVLG